MRDYIKEDTMKRKEEPLHRLSLSITNTIFFSLNQSLV